MTDKEALQLINEVVKTHAVKPEGLLYVKIVKEIENKLKKEIIWQELTEANIPKERRGNQDFLKGVHWANQKLKELNGQNTSEQNIG